MLDNYIKIPNLEVEPYCSYFLNKFILNNASQKIEQQTINYFKNTSIKDPIICKLENELRTKYKFYYPIDYTILFYHTADQAIHLDGTRVETLCSLNLPLIGNDNIEFIFYEPLEYYDLDIKNARYVKNKDLNILEKIPHKKEWILLNPNIPHQVIGAKKYDPRVTLCVRFIGNPTFANCKKYFTI